MRLLTTKRFEKDLKRGRKRGKNLDMLWSVVERLLSKQPLDPRHRRHRLAGDWFPCWECHIEPDWLLVWDYGRTEADMHNEFTAVFERDGDWYVAYSPEIPGANGQGKTKEEARRSLSEAIALILEDRREEGLRSVPADVERETVTVE